MCAGLWVLCRIVWAWVDPALGPKPARNRLGRRKPFPKDAPCQTRGVDTTPGGVHSDFGHGFEVLTEKRPNVDMWTSCSLLIIKRVDVHRFGGPRAWDQAEAAAPSFAPVTARKANLGEPFQCPLHSVLYGTCGYTFLLIECYIWHLAGGRH